MARVVSGIFHRVKENGERIQENYGTIEMMERKRRRSNAIIKWLGSVGKRKHFRRKENIEVT